VIGDGTGVSVRATVELLSQFILQQDSHSLCMSLFTALVILTVSHVTGCCVIDVVSSLLHTVTFIYCMSRVNHDGTVTVGGIKEEGRGVENVESSEQNSSTERQL